MPTYEFLCVRGHRFDGRSTIARRTDPRPCSDCGDQATVQFTFSAPEALITTPTNSQTRWADVAPIDPSTGREFNTPHEAYSSGGFEPFDRAQLDSERRERGQQDQIRIDQAAENAPKRAWKRYQAGDVPPPRPAVSDDEPSLISGRALVEEHA